MRPGRADGRPHARPRAWYAARTVETALADRFAGARELAEGSFESRMPRRARQRRRFPGVYDPDSYAASQRLAARLFEQNANGIVCESVREPGGERRGRRLG